jgi:hypothetical protein
MIFSMAFGRTMAFVIVERTTMMVSSPDAAVVVAYWMYRVWDHCRDFYDFHY